MCLNVLKVKDTNFKTSLKVAISIFCLLFARFQNSVSCQPSGTNHTIAACHLHIIVDLLTHYQTTNFGLVQIETNCRRHLKVHLK